MLDMHSSVPNADGAGDVVWRRQFDPRLDFRRNFPTKFLMVCSTPRSGSHFFCHMMRESGSFGYPLEYLNPANLRQWASRFGSPDDVRTFRQIKLVRTSENGVFAIKAHYAHLAKLHMVDEDPYRYKIISVTRRDKLKQAVSFARAEQTRSWIADMPELADPCYDWRLIYDKLIRIKSDEASWEAYFLLLRVEPLRVYYEDFVCDARAAIEKAYDYLGVERSKHETALSSRFVPSRQADGLAADWVGRFLEEAPSRLHDVLVHEVETAKKRHNGRRKGGRFAKFLEAMKVRR